MECFKDGSIMWSRSGPRDKFWPSIVFRTWDAAKQAGFVPDGIAFLIEAGRKVDVTDAEAAPREGELLNLYLGDTPEWEFIPENDICMLPFKMHRESMSKQRFGAQLRHQLKPAIIAADRLFNGGPLPPGANPILSMSHKSPRRSGVLLDFGAGTSFASFAELWNYLLHNGWTTSQGKGLASWHYYPPGADPKKRNAVLDVDFFTSEDMVINHVRRTGLERPAPVKTVIPRPRTRSSLGPRARTSSLVSDSRSRPALPTEATTPTASTRASGSSGAGTGTASADPSCFPVPKSPAELAASAAASASGSASAAAAAAASAAVASGGVVGGGAGGGSRRGTDAVITPSALSADLGVGAMGGDAPARESGVVGEKNRGGGGFGDEGDANGANGNEGVAGGDGSFPWEADRAGGGEEAELVVTGEEEKREGGGGGGGEGGGGGGGGSGGGGSPSVVTLAEWRPDRQGHRSVQLLEGGARSESKRSHGRTMQVEAASVPATGRGAPNLMGEVMRQAVTARVLASSPPAPSPSKRPKRAGPQLPPQELLRLARKEVEYIRGLADGRESPFPGSCGLENPISEIARFVRGAHSAWMARKAGSRSPTSQATSGGALILAGLSGTGKSTAYQAATKAVTASLSASTLRSVTIKCDKLGSNPNEVFSRALMAITGSQRVNADNALDALCRLAEPSPFLLVLCLEEADYLDGLVLQHLLDMAAPEKALFVLVCMVKSIDRGIEIAFEQGNVERECNMIPMMPYKEDRLRTILGQALGASGPEDKDGEMIAKLVNKGALDIIAKTVARVCGSARIALGVCELAFVDRAQELRRFIVAETAREGAAAATAASALALTSASMAASPSSSIPGIGGSGGGSAAARSPSSSQRCAACVLLTLPGAKAALNRFLVQGPGEIVRGEETEQRDLAPST